MRVLVAVVIDIAPESVARFREYESRVLPLLERHGGESRVRVSTADGTTEVHLVEFAQAGDFDAYLADPERAAARSLLDGAEIRQRMLPVSEVA
jgi:uncharacterized protein (DUF1330 family)